MSRSRLFFFFLSNSFASKSVCVCFCMVLFVFCTQKWRSHFLHCDTQISLYIHAVSSLIWRCWWWCPYTVFIVFYMSAYARPRYQTTIITTKTSFFSFIAFPILIYSGVVAIVAVVVVVAIIIMMQDNCVTFSRTNRHTSNAIHTQISLAFAVSGSAFAHIFGRKDNIDIK